MADKNVNIVIDTIGGDNGPEVMVRGAVKGLEENKNVTLYLTGHKNELEKLLAGYEYDKNRIKIVDASEEITCHDAPVEAVKTKKDSSLVKGLNLVKEGTCDAFISSGSSGAVLAGGQLIVGRAKGVKRTPLAPLIPTSKSPSLLIDCGANVDARPEVLVQFAKMGSIYMQNVVGVKNPTVAIVNIGTEEEKGNALVKETFPLLKQCKDINFIGSIESREIPFGKADVILTEAFVGNVILKLYEGLSKMILTEMKGAMMSSFKSKIGALMIKKQLKKTLSTFSASNKGGAPLLGLKGLVVKIHGNSKEGEVISAIRQCSEFVKNDVSGKIIRGLTAEKAEGNPEE
ncbi:MAG: phosphate acyltransferase PlsX [Eubacterium sp.]|nr:phosphate acyltransferase PlsX [Eubacterium sp.]HBE09424.1 phosphate acyltransferase PlsX [Lachnospiraceae bacterium]